MDVRCETERIDDFEGRGLLSLDAIRIDGVDERDWVLLSEFASDLKTIIEVSIDL